MLALHVASCCSSLKFIVLHRFALFSEAPGNGSGSPGPGTDSGADFERDLGPWLPTAKGQESADPFTSVRVFQYVTVE